MTKRVFAGSTVRINETSGNLSWPALNCKVLILLGAVGAKMIFHGY